MNTLDNTLAAIDSLSKIPAPPHFDSPDYELLEQIYTDREWCSPLLNPCRPKYQDELWSRIKSDERLLMLFRWFTVGLSGRSPSLYPDSDIPVLRQMLAQILSSSELPALQRRAKRLLEYLDRGNV